MSFNERAISYDTGQVIKGVAIILMVFHHCFGFPGWYFSLPSCMHCKPLISAALNARICVYLFAFLTGWFYFHNRDKSFHYSFKKIIALLANYWIVCLPLLALVAIFFDYDITREQIFFELLPIKNSKLIYAAWYVWFYFLALCLLPLLKLIETDHDKPVRYVALAVIFSIVLWLSGLTNMTNCLQDWFLVILTGYFSAKLKLLENLLHFSKRKNMRYALLLASLIIFITVYAISEPLRHWTIITRLIKCIPAVTLIFCILILKQLIVRLKIWYILRFLGYYSMNVWFIHCIFFARPTREFFQTHFFISGNPFLIMGCVFIISLILALVFNPIQKYITGNLIEKLFPSRSHT